MIRNGQLSVRGLHRTLIPTEDFTLLEFLAAPKFLFEASWNRICCRKAIRYCKLYHLLITGFLRFELKFVQHIFFSGPPRRPPQATIDHLKMLNKSLGLDYMFCKSRNPDFLLDIIHSQVY